MSVLDKIIGAKELATLPQVATKVLDMLKDDDIDVRRIARVIEADPALTMKLIRVANSPLYATRAEINSIQQAIMIMGFSKLTNIVLGVSIFSKFWLGSRKDAGALMNKFWWHSSSTGTVAKSITTKMHRAFKENEFVGGLLHQIGKLAMMQYDVSKYSKVIELINEKELLDEEAEKQVYGVTHCEVGEHMARMWKLPDELKAIIGHYPRPSELSNHRELVAAVSFAGLLCELNGADFYKGLQNHIELTDEESWIVLCESFSELEELGVSLFTDDLGNDLKKSADFLEALKK